MKKVLSLVLVIAMVLSSMSFAFAATTEATPADTSEAKFKDIAESDYKKAIETLVALGVVTGYEDGTYKPEKTITRAEFAKLVVEILGYGDLVAGSKSQFTDTQGHWADPWIALAAGKGLVLGTGDGKFTPDRTVSYDEAITIIVRGLGYTDGSNELKTSTWPTNFKVKAAELGLTDDVKLSATGADRGGVAQLLYNALTATLVTVNSDGDIVKSTTQTTDKDGKVVVEYTELLSRIADYDASYEVTTEKLDPDSKNYAGDKVDLSPYIYQSLKVYLNDDDEVVYIKDNNSLVVTGTVSDILDKAGNSYDDGDTLDLTDDVKVVIEDANGKETKVTVDKDGITAFYNGEEEDLEVNDFGKYLYDNEVAKITAVIDDTDDDGILDKDEDAKNLVVEKATEGILVDTKYTEGKTKLYGENGNIALPEDDGDVDLDAITVTGAVDSLEDIEVNDVVVAYTSISGDVTKLVVVKDSVEGLVTETNTKSTTIYVEGTKYSKSSIKNAIGESSVLAGEEGTFYLDDSGKIFATDTDGTELTDYAVVVDYDNGEVKTSSTGKNSVKEYAELTLLTQEGDEVTYPILSKFDGSTLDDFAIIDGDESDPLVKAVTKAVTAGTSTTLDIQKVGIGDLIRYSIDDDGYIDEIELDKVDIENEKIDTDEIEDITTDDTVVFYRDQKGTTSNATDDEFDVVSISSVEDGSAQVVYFTSGSNKDKIAVIYTENAASENDGKYGVVTGVSVVQDPDSSNSKDRVKKVKALVDGEEVTFYTDDNNVTVSKTTTSAAVKFTLNNSDQLTKVATAIDEADGTDYKIKVYNNIDSIDSNKVVIASKSYRYSSSAVVYIYDKSAETWTNGDASDIDEDAISTTVYAVDTADSDRIDIVVQVVE